MSHAERKRNIYLARSCTNQCRANCCSGMPLVAAEAGAALRETLMGAGYEGDCGGGTTFTDKVFSCVLTFVCLSLLV
jgi:hypothetical protein